MTSPTPGWLSAVPRWLSAVLTSVALVAAVTAVIALLDPRVPALGLGVLYLFAVVPIALVHGPAVAGVVSVASIAAFNYFFLPPRHSLDPGASLRGARRRACGGCQRTRLARRALEHEQEAAPALVGEALEQAQRANVELRELAHGILPDVLTRGGLRAGVDALAARTPVPVDIDVSVGRLPTAIEATAYFVVAEALTNVAKHARAGHAEVMARIEDGTLGIQVRDDGVGGAWRGGTGLMGLADRLAALDGELRIESPADGGTLVAAAIPLPG